MIDQNNVILEGVIVAIDNNEQSSGTNFFVRNHTYDSSEDHEANCDFRCFVPGKPKLKEFSYVRIKGSLRFYYWTPERTPESTRDQRMYILVKKIEEAV